MWTIVCRRYAAGGLVSSTSSMFIVFKFWDIFETNVKTPQKFTLLGSPVDGEWHGQISWTSQQLSNKSKYGYKDQGWKHFRNTMKTETFLVIYSYHATMQMILIFIIQIEHIDKKWNYRKKKSSHI